jgi:hypothetical protein
MAERRQRVEEARVRSRMTPAQRRRADREQAHSKTRERGGTREFALASGRHTTPAHVAPVRHLGAPGEIAREEPLRADPSKETPDPGLTTVRHDRKQHFGSGSHGAAASHDTPASNAGETPAPPQIQARRGRLDEMKPAEAFTGIASAEDVASVDMSLTDGGISSMSAPVFRTRSPTPAHVSAINLVPSTALMSPLPRPNVVLYNKRGQLIVPAALKGSHEILVHQNEMADADGLNRVEDDADLDAMREHQLLVGLPEGPGLRSDERLPLNRRYCRPWTAMFLKALSQAHYARFGTPLQVNSAVRTVEFQVRLQRTNGNAAPAEGETASPHLTGQAVDLAKHGLSMTEIAWMRGYLLPLVQEGKIDVEEEFQQACFHISVYRSYAPQSSPKRVIAPRRVAGSALAAAGLR